MGNVRMPKNVLGKYFYARKPVGRPRLRWQDREESSLFLNVRGWRRLGEDSGKLPQGELLKRPGLDAIYRAV